jgi:predicted small lipoprotein YifL
MSPRDGASAFRSARSAVVLALAVGLAGCARKGPPSGGPPDITPPTMVASVPDTFAAGVAQNATLSITFSEGMEPRSTGEAISLAPPVEIKQRKWSGRTVTLVLADTLARDRSYTVIVAPTARDQHGNNLAGGAAFVFTTGARMPAGRIAGTLETLGFPAEGTYLWCYDAARGRGPDSTARDFDALGLTRSDGRFRVVGLPVPGRYRLWVFADLNGNRSFEPPVDVLVPVDSTFTLTTEAPEVTDLRLKVVNPRATGRVRGTVTDTLHITQGDLLVSAVPANDTTQVTIVQVGAHGAYELGLIPDYWRIQAFRDLDRNRKLDPTREPSSAPIQVTVTPAANLQNVDLVLQPVGRR